jgi:hypothetical protein
MTQLYDLTPDCLQRDYHGCGKAWAAVKDGLVIALRYMDFAADTAKLPAWVRAVRDNAGGLDGAMLPTANSSADFTKLAAAAAACADRPTPPHRERYRPAELLTMARAALSANQAAGFAVYRAKCRTELAAIGTVLSGMCSCTKFEA